MKITHITNFSTGLPIGGPELFCEQAKRTMKLLIIEGPDRTGKNTMIKKFIEQAENSVVRHFGAAKGESDYEKRQFQFDFFSKEFELASERRKFDIPDKVRYPKDIWIWNRSHLGEFVYGQLYRDTSPEKWVIPMEKKYSFDLDPSIYLVLLTGDPEFLCGVDDGESFSDKVEDKTEELKWFSAAFHYSTIVNKLTVSVTDNDRKQYRNQDDIFAEINNFVFGQ